MGLFLRLQGDHYGEDEEICIPRQLQSDLYMVITSKSKIDHTKKIRKMYISTTERQFQNNLRYIFPSQDGLKGIKMIYKVLKYFFSEVCSKSSIEGSSFAVRHGIVFGTRVKYFDQVSSLVKSLSPIKIVGGGFIATH